EKAERTLRLCRGLMAERPTGCGQMLVALDFYLGPVQEFAVIGDPAHEETKRALRAIRGQFLPKKVVALRTSRDSTAEEVLPLLAGKTANGGVTTYICQNFACQTPLIGAAALEAALAR